MSNKIKGLDSKVVDNIDKNGTNNKEMNKPIYKAQNNQPKSLKNYNNNPSNPKKPRTSVKFHQSLKDTLNKS